MRNNSEREQEIQDQEDLMIEMLIEALYEGRLPAECYDMDGHYLVFIAASA